MIARAAASRAASAYRERPRGSLYRPHRSLCLGDQLDLRKQGRRDFSERHRVKVLMRIPAIAAARQWHDYVAAGAAPVEARPDAAPTLAVCISQPARRYLEI